MDFVRPIEAIVPGAQGRVLAVLAETTAELNLRTIAQLAGISQAQASQMAPVPDTRQPASPFGVERPGGSAVIGGGGAGGRTPASCPTDLRWGQLRPSRPAPTAGGASHGRHIAATAPSTSGATLTVLVGPVTSVRASRLAYPLASYAGRPVSAGASHRFHSQVPPSVS